MRLLKFLGKIVDAKIGMNLLLDKVTSRSIPEHVCIIMDGNGRWAQRKGLPRTAGHRQGMEMMRDIISISSEIGIKYLTLYAFSTENWKRPKSEIQAIMALLVEYLQIELDALHKNDVRIVTIGDTTLLPQEAHQEIENAVLKTSKNKGLQVNVALNYGGRSELVRAVRQIAEAVSNKELSPDSIDERLISNNLYTKGIPDPDLLIRTGGDRRISNFLLYQIAYTELWFSKASTFWPDFTAKRYLEAILDFQERQRRYGGVLLGREY